jgi:hypothetical protein
MTKTNSRKFEVIEQALQQAVGGGQVPIDLCGGTCSIFSIDVCDIDLCSIEIETRAL